MNYMEVEDEDIDPMIDWGMMIIVVCIVIVVKSEVGWWIVGIDLGMLVVVKDVSNMMKILVDTMKNIVVHFHRIA